QHAITRHNDMPTTTRQLARLAGISEQTVRNWSEVYAELLTPAARGEAGARLFADEDVQVFCSIAELRRDNVPPAEVLDRLRRGDVYIDLADHTTTPHQAPTDAPNATEGHRDALLLPMALSSLQASHNALQRRIEAVERH